MSRSQMEPVSRKVRAAKLRTDAASCEAAGFGVFAEVNRELAAELDPPPRPPREDRRGDVPREHAFGREDHYEDWLGRQRDTSTISHEAPRLAPVIPLRSKRQERVVRANRRTPPGTAASRRTSTGRVLRAVGSR